MRILSPSPIFTVENRCSFKKIIQANICSQLVHEAFVRQWRILTKSLTSAEYEQNNSTTPDPRQRSITNALNALDSVIAPLARASGDPADRKRNLEAIMKRSANFGLTIFSHPSLWSYQWPESQPHSLTVFPALVQITNESGERYSPPREFARPEIAGGLSA